MQLCLLGNRELQVTNLGRCTLYASPFHQPHKLSTEKCKRNFKRSFEYIGFCLDNTDIILNVNLKFLFTINIGILFS